MRLPWQAEPGMVRMSHKKAVEFYRSALDLAEREHVLKAEIAEYKTVTAALEAEVAARTLLECLVPDAREQQVVLDVVLDDLPMTADRTLHVEAYTALVEQLLFAHLAHQMQSAAAPHPTRPEETR